MSWASTIPNACLERMKWTILNAKNLGLEAYFYLDLLYKHKLYFHPMYLTPSPVNHSWLGSSASLVQLRDGEMTTSHGMVLRSCWIFHSYLSDSNGLRKLQGPSQKGVNKQDQINFKKVHLFLKRSLYTPVRLFRLLGTVVYTEICCTVV